ncbi:MAG: hypothetical protein ACRDQ4_01135 [Pseudonocardiaceae bacterium]
MTTWCHTTGESLVITLRPERAGSHTATNPIEILTKAITQIPTLHRHRILIPCDRTGSTHTLIEHTNTLNSKPDVQMHYSVEFDSDAPIRAMIDHVPDTA